MSDENKKEEPGKAHEFSDKADELIDKGKDLADKAEAYITEKATQFKSSEAFGKISHFMGSVGDFLDKKSEELHNGEMEEKIDAFKDKAGEQANELFRKAKETGLKIGDVIEEKIEELKGKKDKPGNQNGGGI